MGSLGVDCPGRAQAAARLGTERRRLFLVGALLGILAPTVPYLTGSWEMLWYGLAATWLPLAIRTAVFLLAFHLILSLVALPLAYYAGHVLGRAFGLSRQRARDWLADWLKATLLGALLGTLVAGLFVWLTATMGDQWWWAFALALTLGIVLLTFAAPYVLVPLFFKMRPLADETTAARVRRLSERAGAAVRDICSLDFSRRTAEANAAVIGLGRSRRVVLADTLLDDFTPDEVDAVVAHELGHHVHRDVVRLLLGSIVLLWAGLAAAAWLTPGWLPILSVPMLSYVPGYPMLYGVAQAFLLAVSPLLNWWSRRLEAAADHFALRLTGNPAAFAGAMRRLACQNLVEAAPPRWAEVLLGSHPSLARRIALAEGWVE